jgi:Ser/Thr protein kinase RdoA (MazF antagonist)
MTELLNHPLALGRTAEIYPWGENQVLKLFYDWFSLEDIEYERKIALATQETGLPVPAAGEIVRVAGRNGLVYQRLDGEPLQKRLIRRPWLVIKYARRSAALHAEMHTKRVKADIPQQKAKLARKIRAAGLPSEVEIRILSHLQRMPEGDYLCHGDFHPGNILVTQEGERIIDWIDSTIGNPLADVARTTIILLGAADCQVGNPFLKGFIRFYHWIYRRAYFSLQPAGKAEYRRWLPIVAAARLSERITELERWLTRQANGCLYRCSPFLCL